MSIRSIAPNPAPQQANLLAAPAKVTADGAAAPNAPIQDLQTTTSTIQIADDLDLKAFLSNREGGSWDDVRGTFDLSLAFAGEPAKGTWTLSVSDEAKRDEGTLEKWSIELGGLSKTPAPAEVHPVAIPALMERFGWPPGGWQERLLQSADAHAGAADGNVTAKELDGYLADPDDLKFLSSGAMQAERNLVTAAGGTRDVSAFEDGWERELAARADVNRDGKLGAVELNNYLTTVKTGTASAGTLWMPDQKAAPLDSRIADFTGEADFLTPGGMPQGALVTSKDYMRISTDSERRVPQWVAYRLSAADLAEKTKTVRSDNFRADPELGDKSATPSDYKSQGYDRGHQRPAADSVNQEASDESFLMSNMAPQAAELNQQSWELLERGVRELVQATSGSATVFTGGLFLDGEGKPLPAGQSQWIGQGGKKRVGVPTHFFKAVVIDLPDGTQKTFAYVLPNRRDLPVNNAEEEAKLLDQSRVPVDRLEELLGEDLFSGLADDVEAADEANAAPAFEFASRDKFKVANRLWPAAIVSPLG